MEKDYLTSKKVIFNEKLIDLDEPAQKEMEAISNGFLGVPFTAVVSGTGYRDTVIGFDKGKLDTILKL